MADHATANNNPLLHASQLTPRDSLAIIGASGRAAAYSALRDGFQPMVADLFADVDLAKICSATQVSDYPKDFLPWLNQSSASAWLYTGGIENYPELVDAVTPSITRLGNSGDTLRKIRSPEHLQQALADENILFPETRRSSDGLPTDGTWLKKPVASCGGMQVQRLVSVEQNNNEFLYQTYIEGTPCSGVYVADGRGSSQILGTTLQLLGSGDKPFQYTGSIGPHKVSDLIAKQFEHIGNTLANRFHLVGLFGVDMVHHENQAWVIEVNPRMTASVEIIERMTDISCMTTHWAACTQRTLEAPPAINLSKTNYWGKRIMFASQAFEVSPALESDLLALSAKKPWPMAADVPRCGTLIQPGQPIATLFASGDNGEDVASKLGHAIETFQV